MSGKNIFKEISGALRKSIVSFPATFVGSIVAAACAVMTNAAGDIWGGRIEEARDTFGYGSSQVENLQAARFAFEKLCTRWGLAAFFAAVFAVAAGLACMALAHALSRREDAEPFRKELWRQGCRTASLVLQALCVPLCVLVFFLLKDVSSSMTMIRYGGSLLALFFVCVFLLHSMQGAGKVAPNLIVALVIAGIASTCLLAALMLIVFAFKELIYDFDSSVPFMAVVCFTYIVFALNVFVAYSAREDREVSIPKPFTVIVSYVLFPLMLVLLAVLYAYLLKCLVTRSMPVGQINPFVSVATALFFLFYVCLDGRYRFFRKWGALLFLPLIPLQVMAFSIRINAYGFTQSRVASLFYIVTSVVFCLLPFVGRGRYMKFSYLLLGLACLLCCFGPLNMYAATLRSQSGRIVRIFQAHGLYEGGRLIPDGGGQGGGSDPAAGGSSGSGLSVEEKAAVVSAYAALRNLDWKGRYEELKGGATPSWWLPEGKDEGRDEHFKRLFGFDWSRNYKDGEESTLHYGFSYHRHSSASYSVDVSQYERLYCFQMSDWYRDSEGGAAKERKPEDARTLQAVIALPGGEKIDIGEELEARLRERPDGEYTDQGGSRPLLLCSKQGYDVYLTACGFYKDLDGDGRTVYLNLDAEGFVCR